MASSVSAAAEKKVRKWKEKRRRRREPAPEAPRPIVERKKKKKKARGRHAHRKPRDRRSAEAAPQRRAAVRAGEPLRLEVASEPLPLMAGKCCQHALAQVSHVRAADALSPPGGEPVR